MRMLRTFRAAATLAASVFVAATVAASSHGAGQRSEGFAARFDGRLVVGSNGSLYTLGPGDATARVLLSADPAKEYLDSPAWSADGKKLLFDHSDAGGSTIEVANANGRGIVPVETSTPAGAHDYSASWLPDGRITFVRQNAAGSCILLASISSGARSPFLCRPADLPAIAGLLFAPRWSTSAGSVAFLRDRGQKQHGFTTADQLTVANADGTGQHAVSSTVVQTFDWSPDGNRLVVVNPNKTISIVSADGTGERVLVRGTAPTWSPNGKWIAYRCYGAATTVCAIGPSGKGARKLGTVPNRVDQLSWQPSAKKLACKSTRACVW
jgi:Tol biopolymer transport system component